MLDQSKLVALRARKAALASSIDIIKIAKAAEVAAANEKKYQKQAAIIADEIEKARQARAIGGDPKKRLSVYITHDFAGTMGMSVLDECAETREMFREAFPNPFTFKFNVQPYQLANDRPDIYLFDYGGVGPGCEDSVAAIYRSLITQIEDHPSVLFVLYSTFTVRWYVELMREDGKDFEAYPNVVFGTEDSWKKAVSEWFQAAI
jgi:hypothetical protein